MQLVPGGQALGSAGSHQPGVQGTQLQPVASHSQIDPSGHEPGTLGSHPVTPLVHRQPSAVHSHHKPGGHEYGSPIVQSSTAWHVHSLPSQKQA
jgi:hypothetical protein